MLERAISIVQKVKNKKDTARILCDGGLDPWYRRGGSSAQRMPVEIGDELPLVCGHERFISSSHTASWPLRMQRL
jgi:hypothetical protein